MNELRFIVKLRKTNINVFDFMSVFITDAWYVSLTRVGNRRNSL